LAVPATKLGEIIQEALDMAAKHGEVLAAVSADLERAGKAAKKQRKENKEWYEARTASFTGLDLGKREEIKADALRLGTGRPRMPAEVVYVFVALRGYLGSVSDQTAADRIRDSLTLHEYLKRVGVKMPASRTILDNVNAVSNRTRELIWETQLSDALDAELEDFETAIIDSTAVSSSSAWPTDSELLLKFLQRTFKLGSKLNVFGMTVFRAWHMPQWLKKLDKLGFQINATTGKRNGRQQRKKLYREVYRIVGLMLKHLDAEQARVQSSVASATLPPSEARRLQRVWELIAEGIESARQICEYSRRRVLEDKSIPSSEKVLSISDASAAMIVKGGREPVLGYKPQIVRSAKGMITGLMVEEGNISDAKSLLPAIKQHYERTGIWPSKVSGDDGYASGPGRLELLQNGSVEVSFSGATGKAVIPPEEWDSEELQALRNKRSSVESAIFTLKYVFGFDHLRRCGIEAVRAELLEKVLAHNFWRMALLRRRKKQALKAAA